MTATTASALRPARASDVPRLAGALAEAFHDDPVWSWLIPAERRRLAALHRFFAIELRTVGLPHGRVWTTDGLDGAAISTPPGKWRMPWATTLRHTPGFARVFATRLPHATGLIGILERRHHRDPHHYFPYIGVAPAGQGRGLGTALMRPTLDACDRDGLAAYLEASCERNMRLYERLGFRVVGEASFAGGPPLRLMLRPPGAG